MSFSLNPESNGGAIVGAFNVSTADLKTSLKGECGVDRDCAIACRFGIQVEYSFLTDYTNGDGCTVAYLANATAAEYGIWGSDCQEDIGNGKGSRCCLNASNELGRVRTMDNPDAQRRRRLATTADSTSKKALGTNYEYFFISSRNALPSDRASASSIDKGDGKQTSLVVAGGVVFAALVAVVAVERVWRRRSRVAAATGNDAKNRKRKKLELEAEPETSHPPRVVLKE